MTTKRIGNKWLEPQDFGRWLSCQDCGAIKDLYAKSDGNRLPTIKDVYCGECMFKREIAKEGHND